MNKYWRWGRKIYYGLIFLALFVWLLNNTVAAEGAIILSEIYRLLRRAGK
jgi:hypothetical protein